MRIIFYFLMYICMNKTALCNRQKWLFNLVYYMLSCGLYLSALIYELVHIDVQIKLE